MAWTASVVSSSKTNGRCTVIIEFTDGVDTIQEEHATVHYDPEWVRKTAKKRIAQLEDIESYNISTGAISEPTPEDEDLLTLLNKIEKLKRVQVLMDFGIVDINHQKVQNLISAVSAGLVDYWDDV